MRHDRVLSGGLALHVAVAGKGQPVILLHGFPENWHSWRHQIAPLAAAGFSVWMPDLRGYNLSDIPTSRHAVHLRHLVADVAAIVAATGYPRAHIVGHDWGGIIAWAFAGAYPTLLGKLVILNAPHMQIYTEKVWRTSQMLRSAYAAFFQFPVLPELALSAGNYRAVRHMFKHLPACKAAFGDADIAQFINGLSRPGALTAALDYYRENMRSNGMTMARAATTAAETLVIWGELDPALGPFLLDGLHRFAPRVRIHRIPHASHWVQNEAPDEVNRILTTFLRPPESCPDDRRRTDGHQG